jgi:hypothetical protein
MKGGRYRKLKPAECPDRRKGDQGQDTGNGYWILTQHLGEISIQGMGGGTYRRPVKLKDMDLHEHTAKFT